MTARCCQMPVSEGEADWSPREERQPMAKDKEINTTL
jgi:hypothetical protein